GSSDSINLIIEDEKHSSYGASRTAHAPVGDGSGARRLSGTSTAVQRRSLGRHDSEVDETLRVEDWCLHEFALLLSFLA
ncbi:hypothetical protein PFISCL1PPCAC_22886, partial [Pristionchus fissidentatus]